MDAERIPDDIKEAARRVVERGYNEGLIEAVEKALLAERERCAKIADGFPDTVLQFYDRPGGPPGNSLRAATQADIAAAIRAP